MNKENNKINFNIYYLNISKTYEIRMLLKNTIQTDIEREKILKEEKNKNISLSSDIIPGTDINLGLKNINSEQIKFKENLEVKHTKSTYLKDIINYCTETKILSKCKEGDLLKINNIRLNFYNEEMQRIISMIHNDLFKDIKIEDYNVNNFILPILEDYPYILIGNFKNSADKEEKILIKIPMENQSEFESKYSVNDLLIGNVSIIGIYKGQISQDLIKTTLGYFSEQENQQYDKIEPSSLPKQLNDKKSYSQEEYFHFIDVIAIVQNVYINDEEVKSNDEEVKWYKKIIKCLKGSKD